MMKVRCNGGRLAIFESPFTAELETLVAKDI